MTEPFSEFKRDLFKSIGSANDMVITPIKDPIAIKNAITQKKLYQMWDKHKPHTRKNLLIRKPSSLFTKIIFDVGITLIIIQREKMIWKADFE